MTQEEILSHVDHTLLSVTATERDILAVVDEGIAYRTASVCIPPRYVAAASAYGEGRVRICTVIGFPNGYQTPAVKAYEARQAVLDGADEIDMVLCIGDIKAGDDRALLDDIRTVRAVCRGKCLKVIIETACLTDEEKIRMCGIVGRGGADYIKTSTGFASGGATEHDVALLASHVPDGLLVKAAGGISSFADAERFLTLGADRLGTSRLVKLAKRNV